MQISIYQFFAIPHLGASGGIIKTNVQTKTDVERAMTESRSKGFTDLIVHQIRLEHYEMLILNAVYYFLCAKIHETTQSKRFKRH